MSFKTRLHLGGKEYDVIQCRYSLHRDVDSKGRPSSSVYGGTISIEIESTEDTSVIESMVNNQYKAFAGKITFKKGDEDATMKELQFEDSYIIQYNEGIAIDNEKPMTLSIVLSSRVLSVQNATLENDWPKA
ncbi:type VI secretion system tube protein TssD [Sphingobacterium bovistauri]|uniref:Type VI secretion system needle protein Hcp n=1 Tax=Sphingobacterium bovistauri TaxID=2781959 RepID=A0ABS7Z7V2_9SPHI|nr:type VI secretion system tube protein TssD [Sphingobacterium bovistauri]MCA5006230.1 type VI secretion system needle protein Hcp [Sphingobacterium bovistauri]